MEHRRRRASRLEVPLGSLLQVDHPARLGLGGRELLDLGDELAVLPLA